MKILALTKYTQLGASSRLRILQYLSGIENAGHSVVVSSLFSDRYIIEIQRNRKSYIVVARCLFVRIYRLLFKSSKFDLILLEKEVLPYFPAWLERLLMPKGVPYILDYDDAVFHNYDLSRNFLIRLVLGNKHKIIIRHASLVIVGNSYLYDYAHNANAKKIEIMPTIINLKNYHENLLKFNKHVSSNNPLIIGWIGQRDTEKYLLSIKGVLKKIINSKVASLTVIGIDGNIFDFPVKSVVWKESTESSEISQFDIGIMPLSHNPFERGKCGYKLIQYMACSVPVIASPVGVNREIVTHGVNGFLAESEEEWNAALQRLLTDASLREEMGRAALLTVRKKYSLQAYQPKVVKLLEGVRQCVD